VGRKPTISTMADDDLNFEFEAQLDRQDNLLAPAAMVDQVRVICVQR
jgi:hypothetical protein